jgi:hypothetical protein
MEVVIKEYQNEKSNFYSKLPLEFRKRNLKNFSNTFHIEKKKRLIIIFIVTQKNKTFIFRFFFINILVFEIISTYQT